jgi:hypothetical protein
MLEGVRAVDDDAVRKIESEVESQAVGIDRELRERALDKLALLLGIAAEVRKDGGGLG